MEIGHLFGLNHPHDYWNPTQGQVEYSWVWGYANTPMTYLLSSYEWDCFEKVMVSRSQIRSFKNLIDVSNTEFLEIFDDIETGNDILTIKLSQLRDLYEK